MLSSGNALLHARGIRQGSSRQLARLSLTQLWESRIINSEAVAIRNFQQRRHQSSQNANKQKPPMPPVRLLLRALRQSLNLRPIFGAFRGQSLRTLFRQSPEELVLAIILYGDSVLLPILRERKSNQFTRFPPQIAKSLRRALYYSNYSPDPKLALKYYKLALEQCSEAGLDTFSDEVMGIKIQLAAWFEKIGSYKNSIEVLEALLRDCKRWVEVMEKSVQDGLVDTSGRLKGAPNPQDLAGEEKKESEEHAKPENLWGKRTRILGKSVAVSVKLGELYADEHVLDGDSAGERLVWAVETVLKELERRQVEGVKEGEGDWMTPEQIGGALEGMPTFVMIRRPLIKNSSGKPLRVQVTALSRSAALPPGNHTLATQKLPHRCADVFPPLVSMLTGSLKVNNLAISLAQQPVDPSPGTSHVPRAGEANAVARPTRSSLLASARSWALQAQATAQKVQGEDRTNECDEACAVALCNLGDIAAMAGDIGEAKRRFEESLTFSRKIAFEPGTMQAEKGLQRLSKIT
ncbi:hypothetical protein AAE478_006664 [Parahypoxylon ruwenzoriense]